MFTRIPVYFISFLLTFSLFFSGCLWKASKDSTDADTNNNNGAIFDDPRYVGSPEQVNANTNGDGDEADDANVNDSQSNEEDDASVEDTNASEEESKDASADAAADPQAQSRDEQRLAHIKSLQEALKSFFDKNGSYPDTLDGLVPDFVKELPKNPTPGGQDYTYTPIGSLPAQFYDLSYELEAGVEGISSGIHVATPNGIAQP